MFWVVLFLLMTVLALSGAVYLLTRFHRFSFVQRLAERHKVFSWLICLLPFIAIGCLGFINYFTVIVVLVHLFLIWLLCDFAAWIIRKCAKKERVRNYEGGAALLLTAGILGVGWYLAHHVVETDYRLETEKTLPDGHLRIALIADSHLSITLSGADFAEEMERVQAAEPDVLVIVGDFVDDDTERADMLAAADTLGRFEAAYGVYFVYGNHDKGYGLSRDFTAEDLRDALTDGGVTILEDESILLDDSVYLIGRQDRSDASRAQMQTLTSELDAEKYQIVLDHQPNDYENEAAANVDLVLSGHTHGGHVFPAGYVGLLIGSNDRVYGTEVRGQTTFLVTSGISGWAIPFKTGTRSEYVIIDVYEKGD